MSDAFQILQEQKKISAKWKRIQTRLIADVESTANENGQLKQEVASLIAEAAKLKDEKDGTIRRAQQFQEELGPVKMELTMALKDLGKARSLNKERQKEVDRLQAELGKKPCLDQSQKDRRQISGEDDN
jgi:uncharacterized coiled-coil DUF342 family protein